MTNIKRKKKKRRKEEKKKRRKNTLWRHEIILSNVIFESLCLKCGYFIRFIHSISFKVHVNIWTSNLWLLHSKCISCKLSSSLLFSTLFVFAYFTLRINSQAVHVHISLQLFSIYILALDSRILAYFLQQINWILCWTKLFRIYIKELFIISLIKNIKISWWNLIKIYLSFAR